MGILKWQKYPGNGDEWSAQEYKHKDGSVYLVVIRKTLGGDTLIKLWEDESFSVTTNYRIAFDDTTFSEFNQAIAEAKLRIRESKRGLVA